MEPNPYTPPSADAPAPGPPAWHVIRRIDPLRCGWLLSLLAVVPAVLGALVLAPLDYLFNPVHDPDIWLLLVGPVFAWLGGFFGGIAAAILYNLCAKAVGGLRLELA
jgi:hypothetical protein